MASWISDYVASGLTASEPSLPICAFRVFVAIGALWKFVFEHGGGGWSYLRSDRYLAFARSRRPHHLPLSLGGYRAMYMMKFVAATTLLVGVLPRAAALLLALWFLFELSYDVANHTTLLAVACAALTLSGGLDDSLTWHTVRSALDVGVTSAVLAESHRQSDPFAAFVMVIVITHMYLSSAYRKWQSPGFRSGRVLHRLFHHLSTVLPGVHRRLAWYPDRMMRTMVRVPEQTALRRWRPLARLTIGCEAALPLGLLIGPLWPYAAVVGIAMHAAFSFILPTKLTPFGIVAAGSYVLFAPHSLSWLTG
jgi:hypothetical protein